MNGDMIHGNLAHLDASIQRLENLCNQQQQENNREVQKTIDKLVTADWTGSKDSEAFQNKFAEYQKDLSSMASFYQQIIDDMRKIRTDLETQMQQKPNIHTDGF